MFAGAGGLGEFQVCVDLAEGDAVHAHECCGEVFDLAELGLGWALVHVVAHDADADVAFVLCADMGALPGEGSALPDSARGVDEEVVADIAPVL